jgi:hypothetical protein
LRSIVSRRAINVASPSSFETMELSYCESKVCQLLVTPFSVYIRSLPAAAVSELATLFRIILILFLSYRAERDRRDRVSMTWINVVADKGNRLCGLHDGLASWKSPECQCKDFTHRTMHRNAK